MGLASVGEGIHMIGMEDAAIVGIGVTRGVRNGKQHIVTENLVMDDFSALEWLPRKGDVVTRLRDSQIFWPIHVEFGSLASVVCNIEQARGDVG